MTANHEHTPTKRDFELAWDFYRAHQDYAMERVQKYHDYRFEFIRGWNEINTAAEQRGAERGWDEAIDYAWDDSSIYHADAARAKSKNPYRADQEGDDA